MAINTFFPIPTSGNNGVANGSRVVLAAATPSAPIVVGHNIIVRIVVDTPTNIRFGRTGTTTATVNDIYIPANVPQIFEMGRYNEVMVAVAAGAGNLYWSVVDKS